MKACSKFKIFFDFDGFGAIGSDDQWYSNVFERKCIICRAAENQHGMWKCVGCSKMGSKPKSEFSAWLALNPKRGRDCHTRCNACMEKTVAEKADARTKSLAGVMKRDRPTGGQ